MNSYQNSHVFRRNERYPDGLMTTIANSLMSIGLGLVASISIAHLGNEDILITDHHAQSLMPESVHNAVQVDAPFAPLDPFLPTPNEKRLASGVPGPEYWQQRVDYDINVELDDKNQRIYGSERITYHNNSPHSLNHIWFQLDQNRLRPESRDWRSRQSPVEEGDTLHFDTARQVLIREDIEAGFYITSVTDGQGESLEYQVIDTIMRVDLTSPIDPSNTAVIAIDWAYNIVDAERVRARSGYEKLSDGNYIFEIAQWYPRVAAYTDYLGWQNKPFLGTAEFTLEFGDFNVKITAPEGYTVAATGELQNPADVLTSGQRRRLTRASGSETPVVIISENEVTRNLRRNFSDKKTWEFQAYGVRDFAWAASRTFIWDAASVGIGSNRVLAMSFYPPVAKPLWEKYSTHAILHTLEVYSRYAFDYPYPVSISVNGPVGGMEYPMITFNKPRPYEDGTYWDLPQENVDDSWAHSKYGLISVIIHEIGHNYFPMIVNSDERRWTWLDEGINTFIQYLAEVEWEDKYPSRRGPSDAIPNYLQDPHSVPIMSTGDTILQRGNNAYAKPATALNVLREVVMGRDSFDRAFKEYSERWKFKRPTPSDFFRTFEDIGGLDLDWFWRGWFYTTDHVDVEIHSIRRLRINTENPDTEADFLKSEDSRLGLNASEQQNADLIKRVDEYPDLIDYYTREGQFPVTSTDRENFRDFIDELDLERRAILNSEKYFYEVEFINRGGLVTPLPLEVTYENGEQESYDIPAEVWRYNPNLTTKLFVSDQPVSSVLFDPGRVTSDTDIHNNRFPRLIPTDVLKLEKSGQPDNPLRLSKE